MEKIFSNVFKKTVFLIHPSIQVQPVIFGEAETDQRVLKYVDECCLFWFCAPVLMSLLFFCLFPFNIILTFFSCMTFLGIKEIIFMSDKYHDTTEMTAARRMFDLAGIVYRQESFQLTLFLFWKGRKWCVTETSFRAIVFFFALCNVFFSDMYACKRYWVDGLLHHCFSLEYGWSSVS